MTERIGDLYPEKPTKYVARPEERCNHPEHNPPMFMVYQPGRYRHTCPHCGKVQEFEVYPEGATL
jgi:hypothetical protein